jgi:biopolymer transport protein ExbB
MTARRCLGMLALALVLAGCAAFAQEAVSNAPAAAPAAGAHTMTLRQMIDAGGWPMYVIGAMSVVGLSMIFYFLVVMREEQIIPGRFLAAIRNLLAERRLVEAHAAARANSSSLAAVVTSGLDYMTRTEKPDYVLLREIVEGEGSRQASMIQNQITYLADIGGIAPLLGLLGTVIGMIKAFAGVAYDIAKAKPVVLAGGVSQALICTVAGLIVAVPALVSYSYFRGRAAAIVSNLESVSAGLVGLMEREK